jgi:CheY-like chemotaxis protein
MPGLHGIDVARLMRAAEQAAGHPRHRLIALTANVSSEDRKACLDAGFDIFLTKPLNLARMLEIAAEAVSAERGPAAKLRG